MATSTTDVCIQIYMKKIVLIVKKKMEKKNSVTETLAKLCR